MSVLHIYGQGAWHDEAFLLGNRQALTELRDAISRALDRGDSWFQTFTTDGEGYGVIVAVKDAPFGDPSWQEVLLPYTDEMAQDRRPGRIGPWDLGLASFQEIHAKWRKDGAQ